METLSGRGVTYEDGVLATQPKGSALCAPQTRHLSSPFNYGGSKTCHEKKNPCQDISNFVSYSFNYNNLYKYNVHYGYKP